MKRLATFGTWLLLLFLTVGADLPVTSLETEQRERLFQRALLEMRESGILTNMSRTNLDIPFLRKIFDQIIVHPSFGLRWDEVPAPTVTGVEALAAVQAFVATNGWDMATGGLLFTYGVDNSKPIRGLPWHAIHEREFPALTHNGILYVILSGWHHDCAGVAYNPKTNAFPSAIRGFKHLGRHWYAWAQPENSITLTQQYEGPKRGGTNGPAKESQPISPATNQTSAAAGSRR